MKILFLDIDGVLNNRRTVQRSHDGFIGIDPWRVALLHRIIEATRCGIVLSSTWRCFPPSIEEVKRALVPYDLVGVTPDFHYEKPRGAEISAWLDSQALKSDFAVERYAILDDDMGAGEGHGDNYFRTTWEEGLTEAHVADVIAHLNAV